MGGESVEEMVATLARVATVPRGRSFALFLLFVLVAPVTASGGPNGGGLLVLHAQPNLEVTDDPLGYCGKLQLDACSSVNSTAPLTPGAATVFFATVVFADSSRPSLRGAAFGVRYDTLAIEIVAYGGCGATEIPESNWPESESGVSVAWSESQSDQIVPIYWFVARFRGEPDSSKVELIPHPGHGAVFSNFGQPPQIDAIASLGSLGFDCPGYAWCPGEAAAPIPPAQTAAIVGACCLGPGSCLNNATVASCERRSGAFQGVGTDCFPNPCGEDERAQARRAAEIDSRASRAAAARSNATTFGGTIEVVDASTGKSIRDATLYFHGPNQSSVDGPPTDGVLDGVQPVAGVFFIDSRSLSTPVGELHLTFWAPTHIPLTVSARSLLPDMLSGARVRLQVLPNRE